MLFVMIGLCLVATAFALHRNVAREGFIESGRLFIQVGPLLIPAIFFAGMISVVVPTDVLTRLLGAESGLRGLAFGAAAGALTPGGPFLVFPLLAVFLKSGAGVGPVTAFMSGWALLSVHRTLMFELPLMGLRFGGLRLLVSLAIPVVLGWLMQLAWKTAWPSPSS